MENWYVPDSCAPLPQVRSVLAFAPHPDDEIFGCGGTLALYRQQGAKVHVHILTDGAAYVPDDLRQEIARTRKAESDAALAVIGVEAASQAGFHDRGLSGQATLYEHIVGVIQQHRADLVLAPSLWEIHPDHLALARAVLAAMMHLKSSAPHLLLYEISAPQRPNLLVDITGVWSLKLAAMRCFRSQLVRQDYVAHLTALNRYRTYTLPPNVEYAEALMLLSPTELAALAGDPSGRAMSRWMETALATADAAAEWLRERLADRERTIAALQAGHERLQAEHERLQAEHERALSDLNWMRATVAAMQTSTSWRVTAPLRWLAVKLARRKP